MYMNVFLWEFIIQNNKKYKKHIEKNDKNKIENQYFYLREYPFHNIFDMKKIRNSPCLYSNYTDIDSHWFNFDQ